jgi:hypothetical protein
MSIELRPRIPGVHSARLSRYPDSGSPYVLELEPAPEARPTLASLKAAFGDYRRAPTHRGMPPEVLFSPQGTGSQWRIVVIAQLASATDSLDTASVTRIALRRDPASH